MCPRSGHGSLAVRAVSIPTVPKNTCSEDNGSGDGKNGNSHGHWYSLGHFGQSLEPLAHRGNIGGAGAFVRLFRTKAPFILGADREP